MKRLLGAGSSGLIWLKSVAFTRERIVQGKTSTETVCAIASRANHPDRKLLGADASSNHCVRSMTTQPGVRRGNGGAISFGGPPVTMTETTITFRHELRAQAVGGHASIRPRVGFCCIYLMRNGHGSETIELFKF
jgi:hypothetical protein